MQLAQTASTEPHYQIQQQRVFRELHEGLVENGTLLQTSTDSETILHLIAQSRKKRQVDQVLEALGKLRGAFCFLILTDEYLFACRDPHGFRPLVLGKIIVTATTTTLTTTTTKTTTTTTTTTLTTTTTTTTAAATKLTQK